MEWEQRKQVTFSPARYPDPDPITMKAALTLCCLLVPAVLALKVTVEEELRSEERAAAPPSRGTRFFWCAIYQGNCLNGCSRKNKNRISIHGIQFY